MKKVHIHLPIGGNIDVIAQNPFEIQSNAGYFTFAYGLVPLVRIGPMVG